MQQTTTHGPNTDFRAIGQAITLFNEHSSRLEPSYQAMEQQVRELTAELNRKNEQLRLNLKEKTLLNLYLTNILEHVGVGIVVLDERGKVELINGQAKQWLAVDQHDNTVAVLLSEVTGEAEQCCDRHFELTLRGPEDEVHHLSVTVNALLDIGSRRIGLVVLLQDVTEARKLKDQAERNTRLTALGQMISHIAHEIRNPLGSIELFASLLRRDLQDAGQLELLDHVIGGINNLNHVVDSHLQFSRTVKLNQQPSSVHAQLDEALTYVSHLCAAGSVTVERRYTAAPDTLMMDPRSIQQVFLNLAKNAVEAMPRGGRLLVRTRLDSRHALFLIDFEDQGKGIPAASSNRIFDPFYTTKDQGTGLGLAICNNIVRAHGGSLSVESVIDAGTTMTVALPALNN